MLCISCKNHHFQGFQALILLDASWVPLGASGCLPGVSWVSPGCLLGVSWEFPGCLLGVSWESPGCLLGISWESPGCLLVSPGCLLVILLPDASQMLPTPRCVSADASQMPLRCLPASQMPLTYLLLNKIFHMINKNLVRGLELVS